MKQFQAYRSGTTCSLALWIVSALAPIPTASALAQGARQSPPATVPMPPRRPQNLDRPTAPATPQPAPAEPHVDASQEPLDRETLRVCATRWQAMKLDGTAAGRLWRDFAKECAEQYRGGKR